MGQEPDRAETRWMVEPADPDERIAVAHLSVWAFREYAPELGETAWPALVGELSAFPEAGMPEVVLVVREPGGPDAAGSLLGAVRYRPAGSSLRPLPAGWASIDHLAVAPDARGEGIGRALVHSAIRRARQEGAARLGARVDHLMAPAQGLLSTLGFHQEQGLAPREGRPFWVFRRELE